jgi:hypothetical protein
VRNRAVGYGVLLSLCRGDGVRFGEADCWERTRAGETVLSVDMY